MLYTNKMMFTDLSDTKQEIILDPNVEIVNLEAAEQPKHFIWLQMKTRMRQMELL